MPAQAKALHVSDRNKPVLDRRSGDERKEKEKTSEEEIKRRNARAEGKEKKTTNWSRAGGVDGRDVWALTSAKFGPK